MNRGDRILMGGGAILGVGLGGFVDGILLHQILQWHEMLSSVVPPLDVVSIKVNMFWDGLFHAAMWLTTFAGVVTLAKGVGEPRTLPVGRTLGSALLVGWGMFNVIEGLIDHQLLGLHHVHPGKGQLAWDIGFLVVSAAIATIGMVGLARGRDRAAALQLGTT